MKKTVFLLTTLTMLIALVACAQPEAAPAGPTAEQNLEASLLLDARAQGLTSVDGQPLFFDYVRYFPPRPDDPSSYPVYDPRHWYDLEFAGWSQEKYNIPPSPGDGSIGKSIIMIIHGEHPYYTAYVAGAQAMAALYQMDLKVLWPNWDLNLQNQMIDQAINERPDLIILLPLDVNAAVQQLRRINQAGIPVIAAHQLVAEEGLRYALTWTGPDEWGPRRTLAKMAAEALGYQGGYAIMTHNPGGSTYFSRAYGYISTFSQIAPDMVLLDYQAPGFDAEISKQMALDWIQMFGDELRLIIVADDSAQLIGVIEAVEQTGRDDIVIIAAGNSKVGMDLVQGGRVLAINVESPAACAATAIRIAADFFNGKDIPSAVYIPSQIITIDNVLEFYPAQW